MSNWQKFTSIATIFAAIAAIAAVIVAVNAMKVSHQANLPVISAISTVHYDETEGLRTEEIIVSNDGFPLREFECYDYTVMCIQVAGDHTYIPIYGYFGLFGDYTGNSKGLLVSMSEKNNYSLYESMEYDFMKEASKDGYQPWTYLYTILLLNYKDYTQADWRGYYSVNRFGSNEMREDYVKEIMDSARANKELMESEGLKCYISALNGTELWQWYEGKYLG